MSAPPAKEGAGSREAFYTRLEEENLSPLWEVLHALVPERPQTRCRPALWSYERARPFIEESGRLITAEEAVRRVLILENPGMKGEHRITTTLYAGWQLILPGEIAPAHRHTQSALRFIVEGEGAYTAVDGERTIMHEGDFVITPSWTWHDHGNESDRPVVWLDGLDIPIVKAFEATFAENYPDSTHPLTRPQGDALARFGSGLLPVDYESSGPASPVFNYPYARTREALETMRRQEEWDPCHGLKLRYVNPVNGASAMPTIGTFMQLLPKGFQGLPYRSTDATVFSVVEGGGRAEIGGTVFRYSPRDVFVVPSWMPYRLMADEESVLFSFSDRPIQQMLGLWREMRGNE